MYGTRHERVDRCNHFVSNISHFVVRGVVVELLLVVFIIVLVFTVIHLGDQ
jgi:hypothetical protein